jgi:acyl-CoA synthetase (AMP-forming)/AMP-acid ligase II
MNDTDARRRNHWVSHIARHAHEKPGGVYLRFEGGSVTWAQIHERVSGLAAALRERGVRAGDRVAIMMTNRPEFLETMFAANAIGAIVVPVNFRLAPDEIAYILTDSGASCWSWRKPRPPRRQARGPRARTRSASCRRATPRAPTRTSRRDPVWWDPVRRSRPRSTCPRTAPP